MMGATGEAMSALRRQDGAALIMLIGIIAALAILATGLVTLTANVQSNTADVRTRSKAFDVAEGAADFGMNQLAKAWPKAAASAPAFPAAAFAALGSYANSAEYPAPKAGLGPFTDVHYYDNIAGTGGQPDSIDYTKEGKDANLGIGDNRMWIVANAATGDRSAKIQAEVQRQVVNTTFPTGIAVWCGGDWSVKGGAGTIGYDTGQMGATTPLAISVGPIDNKANFVGVTKVYPAQPPYTTVDSVISPSMKDGIIAYAKTIGRYYDTTKGDPMPTDMSGVCVVVVPNGTDVSLSPTSVNTQDSPGVLMILGGPDVGIGTNGHQEFWGVYFSDGTIGKSAGTQDFHGMVIASQYIDTRGNTSIYYNEASIMNLRNLVTLSVSLVPNTWRELGPN